MAVTRGSRRPGVRVWAVLALVLALAIAAVGGAVFLISRLPSVNQQLAQDAPPILVLITTPGHESSYPINNYIPIKARAVSEQRITEMELWVDGALMEAKMFQDDASAPYLADWKWVPNNIGAHTLLVRALDADGEMNTSNVVQVTITEASHPTFVYTAQAGDTLESLAEEYSLTADSILEANPLMDPGTSVSPGENLYMPIAFIPPASEPIIVPNPVPTGPVTPIQGIELNPLQLWIERTFSPSVKLPPTGLTLAAEAQGCDVHLYISNVPDGTGHIILNRAAGQYQAFTSILFWGISAQTGSEPYEHTDPSQSGQVSYMAVAVSGSSESQSNPVTVNLGSECGGYTGTESGSLHMSAGKLIFDEDVELAYFYFSVGGGPWQRIPTNAGTFFQPGSNGLDIQQMIVQNSLPWTDFSKKVSIEAWGWLGGRLIFIGKLETYFGATQLSICGFTNCTGGGYSNDILIVENTTGKERHLMWSTTAPGVTGALYYISPYIISDVDLTSLPSEQVNFTVSTTGKGGEFTLDFDKVEQAFSMWQNINSAFQFTPLWWPGSEGSQNFQGNTYYIVLQPLSGNQPVGDISNFVRVQIETTNPTPTPTLWEVKPLDLFDVKIVQYAPIHFPEKDACAGGMILDTSMIYWPDGPLGSPAQLLPGKVICPEPFKGGGGEKNPFEFFIDFIVDAVNWASKAYETVKNTIVEIVSNIICLGNDDCVDTVEGPVMAALNTALVALGLPPSLPNFDQLVNQGMDYLVEEIANQVPSCTSQECKDLVRKGLDAAVDAVKNPDPGCMDAQAAHDLGFEPLCLPEGVTAHPAPAGETRPAQMVVEVTRKPSQNPNIQPGSSDPCAKLTLSVYAHAVNDTWVGETLYGNYPKPWSFFINDPLEGDLFGTTISLSNIQVGETVRIPISFTPFPYSIPGHKEAMGGVQVIDPWGGSYQDWDDWERLYFGSQATISADIMTCFGKDLGETLNLTMPADYNEFWTYVNEEGAP